MVNVNVFLVIVVCYSFLLCYSKCSVNMQPSILIRSPPIGIKIKVITGNVGYNLL